MANVDYKSFRATTEQGAKQALTEMRQWVADSKVNVINIETLWSASGGESSYGAAVKLSEAGFRVWFAPVEE